MEDLPQIDLGPYRLEKLLGRGGMAEVYVAVDGRLGRRVALKRLPATADSEARRQRFRREGATLARLSHPAIVQIFDLVEADDGGWIVMELVDGPTVAELLADGPLPVPQVLDLGRQVAEGLAEAHDHGILHRDLKAENVMIHHSGHAKILDFGLAKLLEGEADERDGSATDLSRSGQILGTYRAMSPEQARGLPLDARSDLFSLGVLLYEMTTGESPYRGETHLETLRRIVTHPHRPAIACRPQVPARLSRLLDRLLEKSPEHRPASAREVADELAEVAADLRESAASGERRELGEEVSFDQQPTLDPDSDRGSAAPVAELDNRETDTEAGSSGTFAPLRQGPRWAFALLAAALLVAIFLDREAWRRWLTPQSAESPPSTEAAEPDAYALFQQGMAYLERFDKPGHLDKAIASFEAVLARDESSAPAHAGLALAYQKQYLADRDPLRLEQALPVAERAVRLDEHLALARVALGTVYAESGRYDEARRELEAALLLAPSNAEAYRGLGVLYERQGRNAEAVGAYEKAVELDPSDRFLRDELGMLYYRAGRYREAEAQFLKSVELAPDGVYGYRNLSAVYFMQDRLPEAADMLQKSLAIKPEHSLYSNLGTIFFAQGLYLPSARAFEKALDHGGANYYLYWANLADAYRLADGHDDEAQSSYLQAIRLLRPELEAQPGKDLLRSRLALYLAKAGERAEALRVLAASEFDPGEADSLYRVAVAHEVCGARSEALTALEAALRAGFSIREVGRDPELFELRSDPRYHRLLAAVGAQ